MKILKTLLVGGVMGAAVASTPAMAITYGDGGTALQGVLDGITTTGPSSVDVTTDYLTDQQDSLWAVTGSGGAVSTMIIELAGFANINNFGVYSGGQYVQLFGGANIAGDQAVLSIKADGSVFVNLVDTNINFAGNQFGFFLDSSAAGGGGLWHSDSTLNVDQTDHMAAFQGTGDQVQLPGLAAGTWTPGEFVLAFEDLNCNTGCDKDYTDFVVMVESVIPVAAPATLALMGLGLLGLGAAGRRRQA